MITLTAIVSALAIGWAVRALWRAFVRATAPAVAIPAQEAAR
jgi:hypothetical protein